MKRISTSRPPPGCHGRDCWVPQASWRWWQSQRVTLGSATRRLMMLNSDGGLRQTEHKPGVRLGVHVGGPLWAPIEEVLLVLIMVLLHGECEVSASNPPLPCRFQLQIQSCAFSCFMMFHHCLFANSKNQSNAHFPPASNPLVVLLHKALQVYWQSLVWHFGLCKLTCQRVIQSYNYLYQLCNVTLPWVTNMVSLLFSTFVLSLCFNYALFPSTHVRSGRNQATIKRYNGWCWYVMVHGKIGHMVGNVRKG